MAPAAQRLFRGEHARGESGRSTSTNEPPWPGPAGLARARPGCLDRIASGRGMIEAHDLAMSYGDAVALRGIRFAIPAGQVCGFLGPNGAGKSTTIKLLAGILRPTAGRARICGHDVLTSPLEAKRALGYVPEGAALYTLLTPREHLALVSDLHELPPADAAARTAQLLELFGLAALADRRIDTLSKGQRQKVAIACALLHDPKVVLLDEPLDGLDANAALVMKDVIRGLAERGRAVLYSSHVLDVVERTCDRTIIIDKGAIIADAPTAELVARSKEATLEAIFRSLTTAGTERAAAGAFLDGLGEAPAAGARR